MAMIKDILIEHILAVYRVLSWSARLKNLEMPWDPCHPASQRAGSLGSIQKSDGYLSGSSLSFGDGLWTIRKKVSYDRGLEYNWWITG
jgi:hypothetical protein